MDIANGKISSKGQLTVPAAMRRELGTDRVRITMKGKQVIIEAEPDLGGSLAQYARGTPDFKQERDDAWGAVYREKYAKYGHR